MLRSRRPRCARFAVLTLAVGTLLSDISPAIARFFDETPRQAPVAAPQEAGQ
jgi:hypothetical protein